jgi:hypothetical protein
MDVAKKDEPFDPAANSLFCASAVAAGPEYLIKPAQQFWHGSETNWSAPPWGGGFPPRPARCWKTRLSAPIVIDTIPSANGLLGQIDLDYWNRTRMRMLIGELGWVGAGYVSIWMVSTHFPKHYIVPTKQG